MKRSLSKVRCVYLVVMFSLMLSGCLSLSEDVTPPPIHQTPTAHIEESTANTSIYPVFPPDSLRGESIYLENCAPCHGETGQGNGPRSDELPNSVPPLGVFEEARKASPQAWYEIVTNGNLQHYMPPFKDLTERQRWDVIAYIYSLSNPVEILTKGKALYEENCAVCHGNNGEGKAPGARVLTDLKYMTGRSADQLIQVISSGIGDMPAFSNFSKPDYQALASYIRSFTFVFPMETSDSDSGKSLASEASHEPTPTGAGLSQSEISAEVNENPEKGTVLIKVENDSGEELPSDSPVILTAYDDMRKVYSTTVSLSEEGTAALFDVPTPMNRMFYATIEYDGATYGSNIFVVETQPATVTLALHIYKSTQDVSVLVVDRLHVFFDYVEPDKIKVIELYVISNPSGRTVIPSSPGEPVVYFDLPEGALNLRFQDGSIGQRYVLTEEGFGDTLAVSPASSPYQVLFAFDMPYDKNKLELSQDMLLPTTAVIVMAPQDGVDIKSSQLEYSGSRDVEGVSYGMYTGEQMNPGETLSFTVLGKPKNMSGLLSINSGNTPKNILIGSIALGLALLLSGGYLYQKRRIVGQAYEEEKAVMYKSEEIEQDKDRIMDAIIALDDLYQRGDLPENVYTQRRAELKNKLRFVLAQENKQ